MTRTIQTTMVYLVGIAIAIAIAGDLTTGLLKAMSMLGSDVFGR